METEVSAVGILDLIRKPATTSQEMKSKLERLRSADPASAGRELELRRKRLLFEGNDKDLDRIEAEIAQNLRDQERYDVAVAELEKQIAQAELEENNAALSAQREAGAAARETSATDISVAAKSVDAAVKALTAAFKRLSKAIPDGAVNVAPNPDVNYLVCVDDPKSSVALARSVLAESMRAAIPDAFCDSRRVATLSALVVPKGGTFRNAAAAADALLVAPLRHHARRIRKGEAAIDLPAEPAPPPPPPPPEPTIEMLLLKPVYWRDREGRVQRVAAWHLGNLPVAIAKRARELGAGVKAGSREAEAHISARRNQLGGQPYQQPDSVNLGSA
jgi:hypothetical protein